MDSILDTLRWRTARSRALARDGHRCLVSRLLGGPCSGPLHVHHVVPRAERPDLAFDLDNLATACAAHHPQWEALRRALVARRNREPRRPRCPHAHRSREAREICERRLARERGLELVA